MVQFVGDAKALTTAYGNISTASVGAIQRGLLSLEQQGGEKLFGEPALNIDDLLQTDASGKGVVNRSRPTSLSAPEDVRDHLVAACGALRAAARGRRSGKAEAGGVLRRGSPVVRRRPAGSAGEDRAGGAPHALQGRRRVLRHAKSPRRARHRPRPAGQPRAARPEGVHAARPAGRARGGANASAESHSRRRAGDHRARRGRGAGVAARRQGRPSVVERAKVCPPRGHVGAISAEERAAIIAGWRFAGTTRRSSTESPPTRSSRGGRPRDDGRWLGGGHGSSAPSGGGSACCATLFGSTGRAGGTTKACSTWSPRARRARRAASSAVRSSAACSAPSCAASEGSTGLPWRPLNHPAT